MVAQDAMQLVAEHVVALVADVEVLVENRAHQDALDVLIALVATVPAVETVVQHALCAAIVVGSRVLQDAQDAPDALLATLLVKLDAIAHVRLVQVALIPVMMVVLQAVRQLVVPLVTQTAQELAMDKL